jgi:hypothetical protein
MALAAIGLLAPMTAYAQTDEKIVLSCTVQMGSSEVVNLDLAAKTVSVRRTVPPSRAKAPTRSHIREPLHRRPSSRSIGRTTVEWAMQQRRWTATPEF